MCVKETLCLHNWAGSGFANHHCPIHCAASPKHRPGNTWKHCLLQHPKKSSVHQIPTLSSPTGDYCGSTAPLRLSVIDTTRLHLCYSQIMQATGVHSHKYNALKEKGQSSKLKLKPEIKTRPCNYITPL